MKKSFIMAMAALLVAGAAFTACSSSENDIENGQPEQPAAKKYTLIVQAEKSDYVAPAATRTYLDLDYNNKLQAYWEQNEVVKVYGEYEGAYGSDLYAQSGGSTTTRFTGTISSNYKVGDELTLKFKENMVLECEGSASQGWGDLNDLEDFYKAEAKVKITEVDGYNGIIKTEGARFVAQQALVRFNLNVSVKYLKVEVNGKTYKTVDDILTAKNQIWLAIPGFKNKDVVITAKGSDNNNYTYTKEGFTMNNGEYWDINVTLKQQQ